MHHFNIKTSKNFLGRGLCHSALPSATLPSASRTRPPTLAEMTPLHAPHVGLIDNPLCSCGQLQTMSHIVDVCPSIKFPGGLRALHCADDKWQCCWVVGRSLHTLRRSRPLRLSGSVIKPVKRQHAIAIVYTAGQGVDLLDACHGYARWHSRTGRLTNHRPLCKLLSFKI